MVENLRHFFHVTLNMYRQMKNNVFPTEKVKVRTLLFNFNGYYF